MDLIVNEGLPFSKVESELFRKYIRLPKISLNTFTKYRHLVTKQVELDIAKALPDKFALVFDGWTCTQSSTHYLNIIASYLGSTGKPETALLAFSTFHDESSFKAVDHKSLLETTLAIFGKSLTNVVCLVGDNCAVNQKLATDCGLPLVGCAAHRFNLEVQRFLEPHKALLQKVKTVWLRLIVQVHDLMTKAKTPKILGAIREETDLKPKTKSVTRWTGAFVMVARFVSLLVKAHITGILKSRRSLQGKKSLLNFSWPQQRYDS